MLYFTTLTRSSRCTDFYKNKCKKLLILDIRIWQRATEMEIAVRHRYAASIGSLVWALTKRESDREGAFDWG